MLFAGSLLTACHGGGGIPAPATISGSNTNSSAFKQGAYLTFVIGSVSNSTSATTRRPQFVSPSILSAVATVYQVYAANPSGNVTSAPLATIGGGSTGISAPIGVAVH